MTALVNGFGDHTTNTAINQTFGIEQIQADE